MAVMAWVLELAQHCFLMVSFPMAYVPKARDYSFGVLPMCRNDRETANSISPSPALAAAVEHPCADKK